MNEPVHFACTACGKCCDSPPTFTIAEAMELYGDFILTVRLAGPIINARLPASSPAVAAHVVLRRHLVAHGARLFQLDTDDGQTFEAVLQIYAGAVRAGEDDPCPMLQTDRRCGIYERRPQRCRTVPFDYWLPAPIAVANGAERLAAALRRGWECDVSAAAPVVASAGDFVPGEYGDAYTRALHLLDQQGPALALVADAFQRELKAKPAMVGPVVNALGQGQAVDFSMLMVLEGLIGLREAMNDPFNPDRDKLPNDPRGNELFATLPSREDFLQSQLALIEAATTLNLSRKRPADRPNTERLRALKASYQGRRL